MSGRRISARWNARHAGAVRPVRRDVAIASVREFAGRSVRVRSIDGTVISGVFRTEILSPESVSVYVTRRKGEGVTHPIDQIAEIVDESPA